MLAITGTGMVTSVGHDSKTSCASIRAGISRREPIEFISVIGEESGEEEPVSGCPVAVTMRGFVLVGRWVRLALACLEDCARNLEEMQPITDGYWQNVGLIAVLPELNHRRFDSDDTATEEDVANVFLTPVLQSFSRPLMSANARAICRGHAGIAIACEEAAEWMSSGAVQRVLVIGVDSYMDPQSIDWLDSQDRLFTEGNPAGVVPGEAAAGFMLEGPSAKGGHTSATLHSVSTGFENRNFASEQLSYGEALSSVAANLVQSDTAANPRIRQVISDMNGEHWRSHELGCSRMRLREQFADDVDTILPAASIGEVGAASGAVAINLCAEAFDRRYAKSGCFYIFSSSDNGEIGVMKIVRTGSAGG